MFFVCAAIQSVRCLERTIIPAQFGLKWMFRLPVSIGNSDTEAKAAVEVPSRRWKVLAAAGLNPLGHHTHTDALRLL